MSDRVSFRVDDELLDRAQTLAEQQGVTLSDVLREVLNAYCDHRAEASPAHTLETCTRTVLASVPAELVAEVEARATRAGLTLGELVVATCLAAWRDGLQASPTRPPRQQVHWPPSDEPAVEG